MKILFISNLFPDRQEPNRGVVNARLLRHMAKEAEVRVISPRPSLSGWWKKDSGRTALAEDVQFAPLYPWVPYVPKVGSKFNDRLYAGRLRSCISEVRQTYKFDAVLCSWLYPDACAVSHLAGEMGFSYAAVAQGSDVHQYISMPSRRTRIVKAVNRSVRTIARSQELARLLLEAGAIKEKLQVIYNGVEGDIFKPGDRSEARRILGLPESGKLILYVGNLLPVKNPGLALAGLQRLHSISAPSEGPSLLMVGQGTLESSLKSKAVELGLGDRVIWAGSQPPRQVALYLQAADVLCLPSDNEGLPNVMLEAFASGLPVVATQVGGIPEVLNRPELGRLVPPRDAEAMANALRQILSSPQDAEFIGKIGAGFSWRQTADAYLGVFENMKEGGVDGRR
ncbi:MAG TPA: glycosyltransferase [Verrucomicrobiae bacterium]